MDDGRGSDHSPTNLTSHHIIMMEIQITLELPQKVVFGSDGGQEKPPSSPVRDSLQTNHNPAKCMCMMTAHVHVLLLFFWCWWLLLH